MVAEPAEDKFWGWLTGFSAPGVPQTNTVSPRRNRETAPPFELRLHLTLPASATPHPTEDPAAMKRKKWTEAEEETLINAYSDLLSSCGMFSQLRTREKKFQPIADRLNSLHHIRDPAAFPFRWSWRDVSVKIQNMRHQYLGVKLKLSSSSPNWDRALHLWPNFLRYKAVFGTLTPIPPLHHLPPLKTGR
ncbi:hypothetical protein KSP40_PGU014758 [Platanthera guangdongensis]|uniref:Uncharacterized protein n=1 Tax=Platanthera guangdongensis TaxID=2320717 RepID=A0ABR2MA92_9ASPA